MLRSEVNCNAFCSHDVIPKPTPPSMSFASLLLFICRHSGDYTDVNSTYIRIDKLDKYHGVPSGLYQADEHLAGNQPMHGTEVGVE